MADDYPILSNIRDYLGWLIGRRVVDVTAGDPPGLPDSDDDAHYLVLHFDNGGTINVPVSQDEGFNYSNPVSAAADRGELCAECMSGKRVIGEAGPANPPTRKEAVQKAGHAVGLGLSQLSLSDGIIELIEEFPSAWKPQNPYYWKNHAVSVNDCTHGSCDCPSDKGEGCKVSDAECLARLTRNRKLTVRQWFRAMRAADFERDLYSAIARDGVGNVDLLHLTNPERAAWTLFDTQQVVDRETAAHNTRIKFWTDSSGQAWEDTGEDPLTRIWFVQDGRVVGRIDNVAIERGVYPPLPDITTCHERGGQPAWDDTDYQRDHTWLGIDRSSFQLFSEKVQPASRRGLADLRLDPPPCPTCNRPRRWAPSPIVRFKTQLFGQISPSLLYAWGQHLAADGHPIQPANRLALCDSCRLGTLETR